MRILLLLAITLWSFEHLLLNPLIRTPEQLLKMTDSLEAAFHFNLAMLGSQACYSVADHYMNVLECCRQVGMEWLLFNRVFFACASLQFYYNIFFKATDKNRGNLKNQSVPKKFFWQNILSWRQGIWSQLTQIALIHRNIGFFSFL